MWFNNKHIWLHYAKDILAADEGSARFLQRYLYFANIYRAHFSVMEVIDLQKYKIVRHPRKVKQSVKERLHIPFVFLSCNN